MIVTACAQKSPLPNNCQQASKSRLQRPGRATMSAGVNGAQAFFDQLRAEAAEAAEAERGNTLEDSPNAGRA